MLYIYGASDKGLRRKENEDCFMINSIVDRNLTQIEYDEADSEYKKNGIVCAVCDGLGGHKGGAYASENVLNNLSHKLNLLNECSSSDSIYIKLQESILECHRKLLEKSNQDSSLYNMGTTIVGVYLKDELSFVFHAGDSRAYCFRNGRLLRLTRDHSLENSMMDLSEDYKSTVKSGIITNCIGGGKESICSPSINKLTFMYGDTLLLCSDGLTDMIDEDRILDILKGAEKIDAKGMTLIEEAKKNGGIDNITVVLIEKPIYKL